MDNILMVSQRASALMFLTPWYLISWLPDKPSLIGSSDMNYKI